MLADSAAALAAVRGGFRRARILVVGDAMVDRYLHGEVRRISPEAPVPVLRVTRRHANPGGCANVAMNLAGLGCAASLACFTGDDAGRTEMLGMLGRAGVRCDAALAVPPFATIVKERVVAGIQQIVRLDEESPERLPAGAHDRLLAAVLAELPRSDALVLSDYAKGALTARLCHEAIAAARARCIPVLVDPKGSDWERYRGATTVTPNTGELAHALGVPASDYEALIAGGLRLRRELGLAFLTFTRGEHGIALISESGVDAVPAQAREVFDVSGAGDTVIATLAAGLAARLAPPDAMRIANLAAGIVVAKTGTVPVAQPELIAAVEAATGGAPEGKLRPVEAAQQQVAAWRAADQRVVFAEGTWDALRAADVVALERARAQGDRLVALVQQGGSVPGADRAVVLTALACIDLVVLCADPAAVRRRLDDAGA